MLRADLKTCVEHAWTVVRRQMPCLILFVIGLFLPGMGTATSRSFTPALGPPLPTESDKRYNIDEFLAEDKL